MKQRAIAYNTAIYVWAIMGLAQSPQISRAFGLAQAFWPHDS